MSDHALTELARQVDLLRRDNRRLRWIVAGIGLLLAALVLTRANHPAGPAFLPHAYAGGVATVDDKLFLTASPDGETLYKWENFPTGGMRVTKVGVDAGGKTLKMEYWVTGKSGR